MTCPNKIKNKHEKQQTRGGGKGPFLSGQRSQIFSPHPRKIAKAATTKTKQRNNFLLQQKMRLRGMDMIKENVKFTSRQRNNTNGRRWLYHPNHTRSGDIFGLKDFNSTVGESPKTNFAPVTSHGPAAHCWMLRTTLFETMQGVEGEPILRALRHPPHSSSSGSLYPAPRRKRRPPPPSRAF